MYQQKSHSSKGFLGFIIFCIFAYLEIFGIYHSFKGHGNTQGVISIFVPPYAWFNAIEYNWHTDDNIGKNINTLNQKVAFICSTISDLNEIEPEKLKKTNETLISLKKDIQKYNTSEVSEIQTGTRNCINYYLLTLEDIIYNVNNKKIRSWDDLLTKSKQRQSLYQFFLDKSELHEMISNTERKFKSLFTRFNIKTEFYQIHERINRMDINIDKLNFKQGFFTVFQTNL